MTPEGLEKQNQERWKSTVETLQRFYTVIVAFALSSSVVNLVSYLDDTASSRLPHTAPEKVTVIALTIALLSTIVPFYHGMERHLFDTHRAQPELARAERRFRFSPIYSCSLSRAAL